MQVGKSTFGKCLPSVCVAGVIVSAVLALLVVGPASAAEIVVHVAPTGDDTGDGSQAKPVASLIGARDAVRRLRADGKAGPVRVVVADGTYRFAEPLVLTPEDGGSADAPVLYEAAPGAKPVLSGGRMAAGQWYFEQLWVDGRRAQRAMEPDINWEDIAKLPSPPGSRQRARDPNIDPFFFEDVVETDLAEGRFRQTSTVDQQVMSLLTPLIYPSIRLAPCACATSTTTTPTWGCFPGGELPAIWMNASKGDRRPLPYWWPRCLENGCISWATR